MKIDLNKLYIHEYLDIDENIRVPKDYYQTLDIRNVSEVKVKGNISLDNFDQVNINLNIKGTFTLPCSVSLEDVYYDFECNIDENIFEKEIKDQFKLDILDLLWENIVLEVPYRVVKEGATIKSSGDGWELK